MPTPRETPHWPVTWWHGAARALSTQRRQPWSAVSGVQWPTPRVSSNGWSHMNCRRWGSEVAWSRCQCHETFAGCVPSHISVCNTSGRNLRKHHVENLMTIASGIHAPHTSVAIMYPSYVAGHSIRVGSFKVQIKLICTCQVVHVTPATHTDLSIQP